MTQVMTVPEAAEKLGISSKTAYRLIREGQIRAKKLGPRMTRVTQKALDDYLSKDLTVVECDRFGCDRPAVKRIGIAHADSSETYCCELHWALDYEGRLGPNVQVEDLHSDHQLDTQEVSDE